MLHLKAHKLILILSYIFLTACANNQIAISASIQQESANIAQTATFTPEEAIKLAEKKLSEAKDSELEFYAPLHLLQAQKSISQAHEYLLTPPKEIKHSALMAAISAQNFIKSAHKNKLLVQSNLKQALSHKNVLIELDSPTLLTEEYQDVITSFLDLIKLIEKGETANAVKKQASLLEDMSELEINTLNNIHLMQAEEFFQKADDIDADKYAEISFEKASQVLDASRNFIQKNYRNRQGVEKAGLEALRATKHAYFVAFESEKVIQLKVEDAEKYILNMMSLFNDIYKEAYDTNLAPQKLYSASTNLITMVEDLKNKLNLKPSIKPLISEIHIDVRPLPLILPSVDELNPSELPSLMNPKPQFNEDQSLHNDEQGFDSVEVMTADQ